MSDWICWRISSVFWGVRSVYFVVTSEATNTGLRMAANGDGYATAVVLDAGSDKMLAYMVGG